MRHTTGSSPLSARAWSPFIPALAIAGLVIVRFGLVLLRMVRRQEPAAARERALEETAMRLRELDRLRDQFVTTVSSELRTPLDSIHSHLMLLLCGDLGELADEQREFVAIADRSTQRLRRLVDDLLLVCELDAGALAFHFDDLDFSALARESLESARPRAAARGITFEFSAKTSIRLVGDRVRLAQLFDNIISNALKFTPRGGIVSVRITQPKGSTVLEVEDTGVGIGADDQKHLFDRFFRAEAAGASAIRGTGLGLSISQAIAEAHGGLIEVTSEKNVGSTFRVAFPANGAGPLAVAGPDDVLIA